MDSKQQAARTKLAAIGERWKPVRREHDELQPQVRAAIIVAIDAGLQQKDICDLSGYSRENVRQIARSVELERARAAASALQPGEGE